MPSILITGCSSGIGYASAHYLRARGWDVIASCRQEVDCKRLRAEGFASPRIDYADEASINEGFKAALDAAGGRIDAVFNNGAFASPGYAIDIPRDAMRAIFETNLFGVHDLTRLAYAHMAARGAGRIIQCSSVLGFVGATARMPYVASKFALEGLTDVWRIENTHPEIHFSLIEPGPIGTKIRINARAHFERWVNWRNSARRADYEQKFMPRLYDDSGKKDRYELPPEAVAQKLERALLARRPKARYFVTTPTYFAFAMRQLLPTRMRDAILRRG